MPEPAQDMAGLEPGFGADGHSLHIALVNNMADSALALTEQRFLRLMQTAFPEQRIDLRCVTLPQIPRGELAAARIAQRYETPEALCNRPPDAVVFSGAEPNAADLRDETFWPGLVCLFDWVKAERIPSLFSCLAAHAAAQHYTGIERRKLPRKAFGLFAQAPAASHRLLRGMPPEFHVAHSRWNEVSSADLRHVGFCVLTQGPETDVDMFVPCDGAPHLFMQGHPEYEATALEGEYRRDLRRFEAGDIASPPEPPKPARSGAATTNVAPVIRNWLGSLQEMVG